MTKLFGVITQSHRTLVVPEKWLESKENKFTKLFFSPNGDEIADFDMPLTFFFNEHIRACYQCEIRRELGKFFFISTSFYLKQSYKFNQIKMRLPVFLVGNDVELDGLIIMMIYLANHRPNKCLVSSSSSI